MKNSLAASNDNPGPEPAMSEMDYLSREMADAKTELSHTIANLKQACATGADARRWIAQYPWVAIGVATVAGFTAATVITPASDESVRQKWSHLRRRFVGNSSLAPNSGEPHIHTKRARMTATIAGGLFDLVKLVIEGLIIAATRYSNEPRKHDVAAQAAEEREPNCA